MPHRFPPCLKKAARAFALAAGLGVAAPPCLLACGIGYYDAAVDRWVATGPCRDDLSVPFVCVDGRNVSLLYFAQGEAELAPDLLDEIEDLVANRDLWNQRLPGLAPFSFALLAYADPTEVEVRTDETLAQKRGESVRDALILTGVPSEQIYIHAMGARPTCPNDAVDGMARNRKVEVFISSIIND